MISNVVMQPHPIYVPDINHTYRDRINDLMSELQGSVESGMTGTYCGRSRHRLPRREGARIAGRTGGAPQYVPAQKCSAKYGNALTCSTSPGSLAIAPEPRRHRTGSHPRILTMSVYSPETSLRWVTMMIVLPREHSSNLSMSSFPVWRSRAEVGSSRIRTLP